MKTIAEWLWNLSVLELFVAAAFAAGFGIFVYFVIDGAKKASRKD